MHIFCDFETRSLANIKDVGIVNYSLHLSTIPLFLAYGVRKLQKQWRIDPEALQFMLTDNTRCKPEPPADFTRLIGRDDVIFHAHNAAFEIYIYKNVCHRVWGWPAIPAERWRCTMAKASCANQPKALDNLGKRIELGNDVKKMEKGKFLIKVLSEPTLAQKTNRKVRKDKQGNKVKRKELTKRGKEVMRLVYDPNPLGEKVLLDQGVSLFPLAREGRFYFFQEDDELMDEYAEYNRQDVVAEIEADRVLPPMPDAETKLYLLDRKINMRGIPFDRQICEGAVKVYDIEASDYHARMADITDDEIEKCTQAIRIAEWAASRVNIGEPTEEGGISLKKPIIPDFLAAYSYVDENLQRHPKDNWQDIAHKKTSRAEFVKVLEVLELRHLAGGTAVAKYQAALDYGQDDDRVRDQLLYHSAATGRFASKGVQVHNMKRESILGEEFFDAIRTGDHALVEAMGQLSSPTMSVLDILGKCVRGLIKAPKGRKLVVSDFAGIEARVMHWLVGGETMCELFRTGQDIYIHAACQIWQCEPAEIATWNGKKWKIKKEHSDKRQIGKIAQLALQYGMGAATYQQQCAEAGVIIDDETAAMVVQLWRDSNPEVHAFWGDIERACKKVINAAKRRAKGPRMCITVCGLRVHYDPRGYLCIRLPSGRDLFYYRPWVDSNGKLYYMDGGKLGKAENRFAIDTYGGKLTENIVQAIARDLLREAMFIIDAAGLDLIFHVHDESVVETDEGDREAYGIVHEAMSTVPDWAAGLPLAAETYESIRYTK